MDRGVLRFLAGLVLTLFLMFTAAALSLWIGFYLSLGFEGDKAKGLVVFLISSLGLAILTISLIGEFAKRYVRKWFG